MALLTCFALNRLLSTSFEHSSRPVAKPTLELRSFLSLLVSVPTPTRIRNTAYNHVIHIPTQRDRDFWTESLETSTKREYKSKLYHLQLYTRTTILVPPFQVSILLFARYVKVDCWVLRERREDSQVSFKGFDDRFIAEERSTHPTKPTALLSIALSSNPGYQPPYFFSVSSFPWSISFHLS